MIKLTDEQKRLFYTAGNHTDYVFKFPDIDLEITNETIYQESVTVKESICEEQEFTLGGCIASSIEFEVSEVIQYDLTGLEFTAEIQVNRDDSGKYDFSVPMGRYRVDSAKRVDDKDYKKITAYDALYDASVDVSEWYNNYFSSGASHTVKDTREALLTHLKIPFISQNTVNDMIPLSDSKAKDKSSLPGTDVLRSLCTINGGFGKINRNGYFEVSFQASYPLFPEETLYPSEDLYPEDTFTYLGGGEDDTGNPDYVSTVYEDYVTKKITCVYIQNESQLVQVGNNTSNPYIISNNFLLYGKSNKELSAIATSIFSMIKDVEYRPNTTVLEGLPYMEAGDVYALVKKRDVLESMILSRTLSGVDGLKDTYEARGGELRANELSVYEKLDQLVDKTDNIVEDVDNVSEDLGNTKEDLENFEKDTETRFEVVDGNITAEVSRATAAEGNLSSRITIEADRITSEVSRATAAEGNLSSKIEQTADRISLNVSQNYATKGELSSSITMLSNQISLRVTEDDVESLIEQNADAIRLKANRIAWDSLYSSMSETGVLECSSATIKGSFRSQQGGNWVEITNDGYFKVGKDNRTIGYIDCSAGISTPEGIFSGIRIQSGAVQLHADYVTTSKSSGVTSYIGGTGSIIAPLNITNGEVTSYKFIRFVNGIMVTKLE